MSKIVFYPQIIHNYALKRKISTFYKEISFKENTSNEINSSFYIGAGRLEDGETIFEKIYTDGDISLKRKNTSLPYFIVNEEFFKAHKGISFEIQLQGATFFIVKTTKGTKKSIEIHHIDMSEKDLSKIANDAINDSLNKYSYLRLREQKRNIYNLMLKNSAEKEVDIIDKNGMRLVKKITY